MQPEDFIMLNDSNYYTLYLANLKIEEMIKIAEIERISRDMRLLKKRNSRKNVITLVLEGTGKALVSTGTKLLDIA